MLRDLGGRSPEKHFVGVDGRGHDDVVLGDQGHLDLGDRQRVGALPRLRILRCESAASDAFQSASQMESDLSSVIWQSDGLRTIHQRARNSFAKWRGTQLTGISCRTKLSNHDSSSLPFQELIYRSSQPDKYHQQLLFASRESSALGNVFAKLYTGKQMFVLPSIEKRQRPKDAVFAPMRDE